MEYNMDCQVAPASDIRYTSEPSIPINPSIDSTEYFSSGLNTSSQYSTENNGFYSAPSTLFNSSRLGPSTTSSGMTHAHRNTLPHPHVGATHIRDQYASSTPSHKRASDYTRSPSFPGATLRRNLLSPITSPVNSYTSTVTMDGPYPPGQPQPSQYPPLMALTSLGTLQYTDNPNTPITLDIQGNIDKGFFLSPENEWTCYRRNYFSCVCSYGLTPFYPNSNIQFTKNGISQPYQVLGFAMCISAVVADNDGHVIDLVQHTPKRDKGPIVKPSKVPLAPRQPTPHGLEVYRPQYTEGFSASGGSPTAYTSEHTFERIQFKQATANNGKRRAAQQYYHLLIEVWADVGQQAAERYIKVGYRKSAKMIVRGRSPGHYQSERRGSTSSGPGSGPSGMNAHYGGSMMDPNFGANMMGPSYPASFDPRGNLAYTPTRHHAVSHQHSIPTEAAIIPPEDQKAIEQTKGYQYYPATVYEAHENKPGIDMFSHHQRHLGTDSYDPITRVDGVQQPQIYSAGQMMQRGCRPFEGKPKSDGLYPSGMVSQSGMNLS